MRDGRRERRRLRCDHSTTRRLTHNPRRPIPVERAHKSHHPPLPRQRPSSCFPPPPTLLRERDGNEHPPFSLGGLMNPWARATTAATAAPARARAIFDRPRKQSPTPVRLSFGVMVARPVCPALGPSRALSRLLHPQLRNTQSFPMMQQRSQILRQARNLLDQGRARCHRVLVRPPGFEKTHIRRPLAAFHRSTCDRDTGRRSLGSWM